MAATNEQVQAFVDNRVRPRVQQVRALLLAIEDDIATIGDVYANLTDSPTWADERTDAPPHLLTANDVLGIHAFNVALQAAMRAHNQLPVVLAACIHSV